MIRALLSLALAFAPLVDQSAPIRLRVTSAVSSGVDLSEYRVNTYGTPDHYCDPTRSLASSGTGTSGDPWNLTQCKSEPICGDVIGILNNGASASVELAAPNDQDVPAFGPTGITDCTQGNELVYVTRYAAITLVNLSDPTSSTISSSANRSEFRHAGTADAADVLGTGGPTIGSDGHDYVIFDGFYISMANAPMTTDSGTFNARNATGVQFRNFAIEGTTTDIDYNPVVFRSENVLNTVLSNFAVWDYDNDPTGAGLNQAGWFSDQYGDRNVLIEHGLIDNLDGGIFLKGTSVGGTVFNYGTIRYNIVRNVANCFRFNDLHASEITTVHYNLCYSLTSRDPAAEGLTFDSITTAGRNITIDHNTFAKIDADDLNSAGGLIVTDLGLASGSNGVTITNNVVDVNNGTYSHQVQLGTTLPESMNYNVYYKNGGTESYVYNSTQYNTFASWQAAISSRDANSQELASSPFTNRAGDVFTISAGHAAKTASSTGGEVGAYATNNTLGPIAS